MPAESRIPRAIIVDDEPMARRRLRRLLAEAGSITVIAECADGGAAVAAIRHSRPDIVFLDVQMPGVDGFGVLRSLGADRPPVIIFVTAYDEYAVAAFEAQAADYLLKPFGGERVMQALKRADSFLSSKAAGREHRERVSKAMRMAEERQLAQCLFIKRDERVVVLQPREVEWIESMGDYVRVHAGAETHVMRSTLGELERRLKGDGFARVHRSRLVNLARVKEFRALSRGESQVVLRSGVKLEASFACLKALQRQFGVVE